MKVSVIIPIYEVAPYIRHCLDSVMRQKYSGCIECMLIDDCGKDDSVGIAEQMIAEYKGPILFKILHHERHLGVSAARNTGIANADGDFLFFLDSDDALTDDCLDKLVAIANTFPDVDIIMGNTLKHEADRTCSVVNAALPHGILSNNELFIYYQKYRFSRAAWNKLIKRSFILQHHLLFKEGIILEDQLWFFYVMKAISKIYYCKDITYHYHIRPQSITTGSNKLLFGSSYSIIFDDILQHLTSGRERSELSCFIHEFCKNYMEHKKSIPVYNQLMRVYKNNAWKYSYRKGLLKLWFTATLSFIPFGINLLRILQNIRLRVKRLLSF